MNIYLPKGFLDKLSNKCKDELFKAAETFEFEFSTTENIYTDYSLVDNEYRYRMGSQIFNGQIIKKNKKGTLIRYKGFIFGSKSFVEPEFEEYEQLLKDQEELKKLKASIANLKEIAGLK